MKQLYKVILTALLIAPLGYLTVGCSEEADCSMTNRAMMQCNLYQIDRSTDYVSRDTLQAILTVTALGTDSVLINRLSDAKELSLPLRYTEETTKLILKYLDEEGNTIAVEDTLTVSHRNTPYFISMDCGYQMKQSIAEVTHTSHLIDSVSITNPEATHYGKENIKLFVR